MSEAAREQVRKSTMLQLADTLIERLRDAYDDLPPLCAKVGCQWNAMHQKWFATMFVIPMNAYRAMLVEGVALTDILKDQDDLREWFDANVDDLVNHPAMQAFADKLKVTDEAR